MMVMMTMIIMIMMMVLDHDWRPHCGGERAQRESALTLIVIHFAEIQNWGRC